ncbi:hypothetical protein BaRGS_00024164, partial [Batillaria attramentaria]
MTPLSTCAQCRPIGERQRDTTIRRAISHSYHVNGRTGRVFVYQTEFAGANTDTVRVIYRSFGDNAGHYDCLVQDETSHDDETPEQSAETESQNNPSAYVSVSEISPPRQLLITGDLNVHFDCPSDPVTARVVQLLQMFDLSQAVDVPTHRRGHTLDPVIYRERDGLFRSCSVHHALSSDHAAVMCYLDAAKPPHRPVFQTVRNLRNIDHVQFRTDVAAALSGLIPTTADDLMSALRSVLDTHAPPSRRQIMQRRSSPWYPSVSSELRALKRERRKAERCWLATRLTVHREIMNSVKHKISALVQNAKTAFYSAKVAAATTCRELFRLTGNLMGKCTQTPLPSIHPPHQLAQIFSDFFSEKISSLRIALDSQMSSSVQPAFQDRMFSGTPLTCFDVVSQEAVRKIALS